MSIGDTVVVVGLLVLSALFSGLTLGLLGLAAHDVRRKARLGDPLAERVWQVRQDGNRLLVSLLLGNVLVNAVLSIYLGDVMAGTLAAAVATGLIVVFGEIVPQAVFHRYGLTLSARFVPFVRALLFLTAPVAKPIAWVLDRVLGHELPTLYTKNEIIELIAEHEDSTHSDIDEDEERIVRGALTFSSKRAGEIMTRWEEVVWFPAHERITKEVVQRICASGFSRFPLVGNDGDVVCVLHLHDFVCAQEEGKKEGARLGEIASLPARSVPTTMPLDEVLRDLLVKGEHLRIVRNKKGNVVGIITLEDILEEIIEREIRDERD